MEVTGNAGGNADRLAGNHEVRQKWMNFRRGVLQLGCLSVSWRAHCDGSQGAGLTVDAAQDEKSWTGWSR